MNAFRLGLVVSLVAAPLLDESPQTYSGVITDTMCGANHAAMKVTPDAKCVRDCVRDSKTFQHALLEGKALYKPSDQETPAKFAGQKVKVTGVLYAKTNILQVQRIDRAE